MGRITLLATGERLVSGGVRAFDPVIGELLQAARREIQLAIYRFDESAAPLLDLLEQAAARGVRVLTRPPGIRERLERLRSRPGIRVVDFEAAGEGLLHARVIVADRERAVIGSANLTWGGLVRNHEVGVLIEGSEVWEIARLVDRLAIP